MAALRAELAYFATLCIMVLAIPLLLPVAKAHAFLGGLVICSQQGISAQPGSPAQSHREDCPCVIACGSCPGGMAKALRALHPSDITPPQPGYGWTLVAEQALASNSGPAGSNAIRAPPHFV